MLRDIETTHPEIKTLLGDKECRNETAKANTEKTKKKKPTRDWLGYFREEDPSSMNLSKKTNFKWNLKDLI